MSRLWLKPCGEDYCGKMGDLGELRNDPVILPVATS